MNRSRDSAYNQDEYKPEKWWQGPTWLPIAYFMLEILRDFGYDEAYQVAAERLYRMIVKDGNISELFDSRTGRGLGNRQQGWSAAILLELHYIIQR